MGGKKQNEQHAPPAAAPAPHQPPKAIEPPRPAAPAEHTPAEPRPETDAERLKRTTPENWENTRD